MDVNEICGSVFSASNLDGNLTTHENYLHDKTCNRNSGAPASASSANIPISLSLLPVEFVNPPLQCRPLSS